MTRSLTAASTRLWNRLTVSQITSRTLACAALLACLTAASAQTWSPEQQDILKIEKQQWQMVKDKDTSWIDKMVHPNFSGWETGNPMPQNKESLARWSRYHSTSGTVLEQELFPISIAITGNIAVVQYCYSEARENFKKERDVFHGHYTDVLVKEGDHWLFIAWAGGDDPKK